VLRANLADATAATAAAAAAARESSLADGFALERAEAATAATKVAATTAAATAAARERQLLADIGAFCNVMHCIVFLFWFRLVNVVYVCVVCSCHVNFVCSLLCQRANTH
jgi:hypothetical protein